MPTPTVDLGMSFAIPDDADGLETLLNDTDKMEAVFNEHGPGGWAKLNAAYQQAAAARDKGEMAEQMRIDMEAQFADLVKANGGHVEGRLNVTAGELDDRSWTGKVPSMRFDGSPRSYYSNAAPGHELTEVYGDKPGDAIRAILGHENPALMNGWEDREAIRATMADVQRVTAAYSSHVGPDGGFLLPESFRAELLAMAHEMAVMRPGATVIPMSTPKVSIPTVDETDRSSSLYGGVVIYWANEDEDSTDSNAKFGVVSLEPDTMAGYTEVPNETLADTYAADAFFSRTFPSAMAFEEDDAFMTGNGVGRPLGWMNSPAQIEVAKESGQAADSIVIANILKMYARMLPGSLNSFVWVANQTTIPQLGTLQIGDNPVLLPDATGAFPFTLMGRPLLITEKAKALGDAGDISAVDRGFYLVGDRQTATATSSTDYKFKSRKTAFSVVCRVDGRPWVRTPVQPRNGDTISPFVSLAERA